MQISKLNTETLNSFFNKPSQLQLVEFDWREKKHTFYMLREDLLHPHLSGNKFRKLYGWLLAFTHSKAMGIATMGGAYSNHIAALAYACFNFNIPLKVYCPIGANQSLLLSNLKKIGVDINYVEREYFRTLRHHSQAFIDNLFWVPEGGKGENAALGFQFLGSALTNKLLKTVYVCAGTGSTAKAFSNLGYSVTACLAVKDASVATALSKNKIGVEESFKLAKFGKINTDILEFASEFYKQTTILLDPIYQSKALLHLCNENKIGTQDVFVHTGGLQGWQGYALQFEEYFGQGHKTELFNTFESIFSH